MWAVAVIFLAALGMGVLYFLLDAARHKRAERARHEAEVNNVKARLDKALKEWPYDVALHAALRDELLRLQNRK